MTSGGEVPKREEQVRVEAARRAIAEAQRDVTEAIGEIEAAARADKRHAGDRLKAALDGLRAAQTELTRLESLILG